MGRIALATVVLAGLAAPAGASALAPRWTAKGAITRLNTHAITVHGTSCRITPASPGHAVLRIFVVGSKVKIECANGVLLEIDGLRPLPPIDLTPTAPSSASSSSTTLAVSETQTSSNGSTESQTVATGNFPITALGNGSISAGTGSQTVTCQVGSGSPDVSGYHVGDRLSRLECRGGVLSVLSRA